MNRLLIALALTPALFATGALAQTVGDDVTKELWCGSALVIAFSNPPEGVTPEQMAQAKIYIDGGNKLLDDATQKHLDAGFTEEQVTKIKADLNTEVTAVVTGDGSNAKYSFDECAALVPQPTAGASAPADEASAPSSTPADDTSSSSAQ